MNQTKLNHNVYNAVFAVKWTGWEKYENPEVDNVITGDESTCVVEIKQVAPQSNVYFTPINRSQADDYQMNFLALAMLLSITIDKNEFKGCFYQDKNRVHSINFWQQPIITDKTWTENVLQKNKLSRISYEFNFIIKKMKSFSLYKEGWDSYNGKKIKSSTISKAIGFLSDLIYHAELNKKVLPIPFVAPLPDGGIQFEWNTFYREFINIIPEDDNVSYEYYKMENFLSEIIEEEHETYDKNDIIEEIIGWFLRFP